MKKKISILFIGLFLAGFLGALFLFSDFIVEATNNPAGSNISVTPTEHWAWNDAVGWIDFHTNDTVKVKSQLIEGYAIPPASSPVKELSLDCATSPDGNICSSGNGNYKVINDGCGSLSGWAWNEVYGWTSFNCSNHGGCGTGPGSSTYGVVIGSDGQFSDYAWNDVIGWISFNCLDLAQGCTPPSGVDFKVKTTWIPTSTSAYLDSSTFDTGVPGGAQLNSIMWLGGTVSIGSSGAGACASAAATKVGFQIAASSTPSGPWNFIGPYGTSDSVYEAFFDPSKPGVSIPLDYTLHNNQRYFRYRVLLFSDQAQSQSPRVDDVIINWSP